MKIYENTSLIKFILKKMAGKNWVTAKNKKGKALVKEIAVAISEKFTDADGNFDMPIFKKVVKRNGYIEFCDQTESMEASLILKPNKGDTIDFNEFDKVEETPTTEEAPVNLEQEEQ